MDEVLAEVRVAAAAALLAFLGAVLAVMGFPLLTPVGAAWFVLGVGRLVGLWR